MYFTVYFLKISCDLNSYQSLSVIYHLHVSACRDFKVEFRFRSQVEKQLALVSKFETIKGCKLDYHEKYSRILANYGKQLDNVRRLYQKHKNDPPTPRNMPPVAGKIAWARHLYRMIETPMNFFKGKPELLQSSEGKSIIKNYNKLAAVLLEFEVRSEAFE